jgi:hypothetical protein
VDVDEKNPVELADIRDACKKRNVLMYARNGRAISRVACSAAVAKAYGVRTMARASRVRFI